MPYWYDRCLMCKALLWSCFETFPGLVGSGLVGSETVIIELTQLNCQCNCKLKLSLAIKGNGPSKVHVQHSSDGDKIISFIVERNELKAFALLDLTSKFCYLWARQVEPLLFLPNYSFHIPLASSYKHTVAYDKSELSLPCCAIIANVTQTVGQLSIMWKSFFWEIFSQWYGAFLAAKQALHIEISLTSSGSQRPFALSFREYRDMHGNGGACREHRGIQGI